MSRSSTFTPDDAYAQIADAALHPVQEQGPIKAYYLKKYPDQRMMSTLLIFSPEGITITGDLRPCQNGVTILGHNLEWFASKQEPEYLASKCLEKSYSDTRARDDIQQMIRDWTRDAWKYRDPHRVAAAKALRAGFRELNEERDWDLAWGWQEGVHSVFHDILQDGIYGVGLDYDIGDFAWLSAIQRRFAEAYREHQEKTAAAVPSGGGVG
jgi:hypothetical protein